MGLGIVCHCFEDRGGELGDEVRDFGGGEGVVDFESGHVQALLGHCPKGFLG